MANLSKPSASGKAQRSFIKEAAKARSDLIIFAAVAALMESSLLSSACFSAEAQIVRICRREEQKCLARFDCAIAQAERSQFAQTD